jgi:hypothetical protein
MSTYTEDYLVEQPAIQLMQHELGWDVVNCFGEPSSLTILRRGFERQELRRSGWNGGLCHQGRDGNLEVPENNDFLISLKATFSPSAETVEFTEIKHLQDFTESTNFTAC